MDFTNERFWKRFWSEFKIEVENIAKHEGGFSFELPKEEQIRASLYSNLKKAGYVVEIESDVFDKKKRVIGETDLRVFDTKVQLLVEIKRTWALKEWVTKYTEHFRDWQNDIDKLNEAKRYHTKKASARCFVLVVFSDSDESSGKVKLDEINRYIRGEWGGSVTRIKLNDKIEFDHKFGYARVWIEKVK